MQYNYQTTFKTQKSDEKPHKIVSFEVAAILKEEESALENAWENMSFNILGCYNLSHDNKFLERYLAREKNLKADSKSKSTQKKPEIKPEIKKDNIIGKNIMRAFMHVIQNMLLRHNILLQLYSKIKGKRHDEYVSFLYSTEVNQKIRQARESAKVRDDKHLVKDAKYQHLIKAKYDLENSRYIFR